MSRSRLLFRPEDARRVLWVQCLEEADATGALIPVEARAAAGREASTPDDALFLSRRAAILTRSLPAGLQAPEVARDSWVSRLPAWLPWALTAAAFAFGWLTSELGSGHIISILSFPLLGLILWNLLVVGASLWSEWKHRKSPPAPPAAFRRLPGSDALTIAKGEFSQRAATWEKPVQKARLMYFFHAAAIALALGVVAGMYVRGLSTEYKVAWESTFLSEQHVRALTGAVLGPASLITGIPVPEPAKHGSAAPWIHLWAASAVLFIVIPRLLLVNMARREAARALPDYRGEFSSWLAVCRSMVSGQTRAVPILAVHYEPGPRVRDAIRLAVQHLWGAQVSCDFLPPVIYGAEDGTTAPPGAEFLVLVFPLSTTPETEVHGALIAGLAASVPERSRGLVVLDASNFEARFRTLPEYSERLAARLAAWEKTIAGCFPLLLLDDAARRDPAAAVRTLS